MTSWNHPGFSFGIAYAILNNLILLNFLLLASKPKSHYPLEKEIKKLTACSKELMANQK
jgi:hypothetical protein